MSEPQYDVFYRSRKGKQMCMVCLGEQALRSFISNLRRNAQIKYCGKNIGLVWKEQNRWHWYFEND